MTTQVEPEMGAPSSNTGKLFSLTDVYRIYGEEPVAVHALDGVSVEINSGDFMAIIGPSGSGKSTLLGLLGCLDLPSRGSIKVSGTEVTELDDAERSKLRGDSIGFVFQQFHLTCQSGDHIREAVSFLYFSFLQLMGRHFLPIRDNGCR